MTVTVTAQLIFRRKGQAFNSLYCDNPAQGWRYAAMASRYSDCRVELWYVYDRMPLGTSGRKMVARWSEL